MLTLRADQAACLQAVEAQVLSKSGTALLVAATGWGKTVLFSELTRRAVLRGKRVMILVHRTELLDQVSRTLTALDVTHGCIAPDAPNESGKAVQVASVFALARRLAYTPKPDLLIIDEAHHAIPGSTWGKCFAAWPGVSRLGVTATPERLGGEGLRDTFATMLFAPSVKELIEAGHLSHYRLFAPPQHATEGIHRRMGDYAKTELSLAMDKPTITGDAVAHYRRLAFGKRAIVFCVSVAHAEHVAATFVSAGLRAASLDGKLSPHIRKQRLDDFRSGRCPILTSCDLISEGFDLPAIEVAILLRPTQSLALHLQQVGRALRTFPGKDCAIILDHAGNTARHGLPDEEREWSLDGSKARKQSDSEKTIGVKTCGQCFAAVRSFVMTCPECGYVWPIVSREIEVVAGELEEIDLAAVAAKKRKEVGMAQGLDDLLKIEKERGYKSGWAHYVWKARQARYTRGLAV